MALTAAFSLQKYNADINEPFARNLKGILTKGFQDQNAGPEPGWLPPEARKKKLDIIIFSLCEACLSTNNNIISIMYYI